VRGVCTFCYNNNKNKHNVVVVVVVVVLIVVGTNYIHARFMMDIYSIVEFLSCFVCMNGMQE